MLENSFQAKLIKEIESLLPGCIIFKNDANQIQGYPDLTILYKNRWAALECKKSKYSIKQPNQEYYINLLNNLSFARFIYPENKNEVLYDLQRTLRS